MNKEIANLNAMIDAKKREIEALTVQRNDWLEKRLIETHGVGRHTVLRDHMGRLWYVTNIIWAETPPHTPTLYGKMFKKDGHLYSNDHCMGTNLSTFEVMTDHVYETA